jgi:hypothetical protein
MDNGPVIAVEQSSVSASHDTHVWSIEWTIVNKSVGTIMILGARLPHGQFKSAEQRFDPPLKLHEGGQVAFRALVHCHEPPGLVTENAFIIFQVVWSKEAWRIFVRSRVVVEQTGDPQTSIQLITTQKVSFSGSN